MITGQDHRPDPVQRARRADALASGQPGGEILQPAQRAGGLGQCGESLSGLSQTVADGGLITDQADERTAGVDGN